MVSSQLQDAINNTKSPSRVPHVISQLWEGAVRDSDILLVIMLVRMIYTRNASPRN